jgi:lactate permease
MAGLGFEALYAAALALLANTAPVAFGGFGIPILTGAAVSGLDTMELSQMVGRQTPILAVIIPGMLVTVMAGFRRMLEVWPLIVVSGVSFAGTQFLVYQPARPGTRRPPGGSRRRRGGHCLARRVASG